MAPHTLPNISLIVQREYRARVHKRTFLLGTLALVVLALAGTIAPTIIQQLGQGDAQTQVAVLNQAGAVAGQETAGLVAYLDQSLNATRPGGAAGAASSTRPAFVVTAAASGAAVTTLEQQVKAHTLASLLVIRRGADGELTFQYTTKRDADSASAAQVRQTLNALAAADRLQRAGLSTAQQQQAFRPAQVTITSTSSNTFNNGKSDAENIASYAITTAMVVLMYTMIIMYGGWIAGGVVEEKSSRIMEIMINAATPMQLMAGKILGVGAAALTQMGALVSAGILGFLLQGPINQALVGGDGPPRSTSPAPRCRCCCSPCSFSCWALRSTAHSTRDWARWSAGRKRWGRPWDRCSSCSCRPISWASPRCRRLTSPGCRPSRS